MVVKSECITEILPEPSNFSGRENFWNKQMVLQILISLNNLCNRWLSLIP